MKGQSSFELFITLGIVFAFTVPVLFLIFSLTSSGYEQTSMAQADASARSLADSINFVYSQGPGAKRTILINAPAATNEIRVGDGEVVFELKTASGTFDAVSTTFATIEPSSPVKNNAKKGLFRLLVENRDGKVRVRDPDE